MITISQEKFERAKTITESLERHVRKLRAGRIYPDTATIKLSASINKLLDECLAEFEEDLSKMAESAGEQVDPNDFTVCGAGH